MLLCACVRIFNMRYEFIDTFYAAAQQISLCVRTHALAPVMPRAIQYLLHLNISFPIRANVRSWLTFRPKARETWKLKGELIWVVSVLACECLCLICVSVIEWCVRVRKCVWDTTFHESLLIWILSMLDCEYFWKKRVWWVVCACRVILYDS